MERIGWYERAAGLWRNASVRRLVWLLLAAGILAVFLAWLYAWWSAERLGQAWLAQQTALLGELASSDPEAAGRLARRLANPEDLSPEGAALGREWAAQYGLSDAAAEGLSPLLENYRRQTGLLLGAGLLLLLGMLGALLLRDQSRELAQIRKLAEALERAVKHRVPMSFRLYREGELGLLASSVHELAIRLQETIAQLHRDKRFLKDTIADISHQLKTPLSSLIIYTDLLREGNVDPDTAREFLDTCRRQLDRMEWLIQTLLTIARLEADALQLQIQPDSMKQTVRRACEAVRRLAEDRNVEVSSELPDSDPLIFPHDSRWLAEAIANLLKNAVEHSPAGSRVQIRFERTPVFVRLLVDDRGPGIEEKHLPHIFKKFYRSSAHGSGAGLGLPLAKSIVERHGGMLSAVNRPGGGTRFTVSLPMHPMTAPPPYKSVSPDRDDL